MSPPILVPVIAAVLTLAGGPSGVQYGLVTAKSYDATPWSSISCPNHYGCTRTEHPDCWRLEVRLGPLRGARCVSRAEWEATPVGSWS